jgi:hypothetical protein
MAKFTVQLNRKKKLHNGLYNLVVRVNTGNDMIYLNFSKLTENHYDHVFVKKYGDEDSIAFREKCEGFRTKCERTYNKVKSFNKARLRGLLKDNERKVPHTLKLKNLFTDYGTKNDTIKYITVHGPVKLSGVCRN